MKIITRIYVAIGFILVLFSLVTTTYLLQARHIQSFFELLLHSSDVMRVTRDLQKSVVDMESGLRGYLLAEDPLFLTTYNAGRENYTSAYQELTKLLEHSPDQFRYIQQIDSVQRDWNKEFAERGIKAKMELVRPGGSPVDYEYFYVHFIKQAEGKRRIDRIRSLFDELYQAEDQVRLPLISELNVSLQITQGFFVLLTAGSILLGIITAYILTVTIRKRIFRMKRMAAQLASGNFTGQVVDREGDELSDLSVSLNQMATKLEIAFENLGKSNQELDQFAYVASHDLKAPLRAINSLAEWLEEDLHDSPEEIKSKLRLLRGRAGRMENLLNGILDYSRIGHKPTPVEPVKVRELLEEIILDLSPPPGMAVHLSPTLPEITTERILLSQVFANLLSNALKYHDKPEGHVWVGHQEVSGYLQFSVADDGPGIAPEYREKAFAIFQTLQSRDKKEATGVGLAIVKKIVEGKGGRIWIDPDTTQGTTFHFTWPIADPASNLP